LQFLSTYILYLDNIVSLFLSVVMCALAFTLVLYYTVSVNHFLMSHRYDIICVSGCWQFIDSWTFLVNCVKTLSVHDVSLSVVSCILTVMIVVFCLHLCDTCSSVCSAFFIKITCLKFVIFTRCCFVYSVLSDFLWHATASHCLMSWNCCDNYASVLTNVMDGAYSPTQFLCDGNTTILLVGYQKSIRPVKILFPFRVPLAVRYTCKMALKMVVFPLQLPISDISTSPQQQLAKYCWWSTVCVSYWDCR